jgi:transcriptional regulator with XRE-family HTH domain
MSTRTEQAPMREATSAIVAKILKIHRARLKISQERLALLADVDRTYVGKVERAILNPTLYRINRLLHAAGISWQDFGATLDAELRRQ